MNYDTLSREDLIARLEHVEAAIQSGPGSPTPDSHETVVLPSGEENDLGYTNALHQLELQRSALDHHSIVAITDPKGVISYVNEKFCAISEYSRDELIGRTHSVLNSGYHSREFFVELWGTIASGHVWKGEVCNRSKSGRLYWVETTIVPFMDREGDIREYVAIRTDITDKKALAEKSEQRRLQLIKAERMVSLGTLAAGVAHEISQPLNALKVTVDGMEFKFRNGWEPSLDEIRENLRTVSAQGARIEDIIQHMRTLYLNNPQEKVQTVELSSAIRRAVKLVGTQIKSHGIVLELVCDEDIGMVQANAIQLEQVIINLLVNARQALDQQSAGDKSKKMIRVTTRLVDGTVELSVEDNGPGFKGVEDKIFDPFFSSKTNTKDGGMGLGLSLVQTFIHSWGARITAESKRDGGARFAITFAPPSESIHGHFTR